MKHFLTLIFCLTVTAIFAQNKGINLLKMASNDTIFLQENRRIKVKTTDGTAIAGKFSVVNDSEINIKGYIIVMDSIVSIKKASIFSAIARPISIAVGATFLLGGMAALAAGGIVSVFAVVLIPVGLPLFIVPFTTNTHPIKKWKYEIVNP
jgi:predicted phage tail protein